jgi:hypothetical protein
MQTLVRNIQLNFATSEKKLTVGNLSLQKNYIHILEAERFKERGCLFTKEHHYLQTQFDLTGAEDCQLISFDEKLNFKTVRYYRNHQNAPFSFFITAPYVLILPDTHSLPVQSTRSLQLLDYPSIRGIHHIFGTDAEKVEILAGNPHRFYVSEYGIWTLPNSDRLSILSKIYKKAQQQKNEILCKRIEQVTKQLQALPAYQ